MKMSVGDTRAGVMVGGGVALAAGVDGISGVWVAVGLAISANRVAVGASVRLGVEVGVFDGVGVGVRVPV